MSQQQQFTASMTVPRFSTKLVQGIPGPPGPPGPPGADGQPGPPGASSNAAEYSFNETTSAPPGNGQLRLNNADQTLATVLWLDDDTATGSAIGNFVVLMKTSAHIYLQDKDDSTRWQAYELTAAAIDRGTYTEFAIRWVDGASPVPAQRIDVAFLYPGTPQTPWTSDIDGGKHKLGNVSQVSTDLVASVGLNLYGSGTFAAYFNFGSPGFLNRWSFLLNSAESGANAGSDFIISSYDDAGNYLGSPLSIYRASGLVVVGAGGLDVFGPTILSLSAANPALLANGQMMIAADEPNNRLVLTYRTSTGLVKTVNLPWS